MQGTDVLFPSIREIIGGSVREERLILFVTGMQNIRDVIPFPRTPKNAAF